MACAIVEEKLFDEVCAATSGSPIGMNFSEFIRALRAGENSGGLRCRRATHPRGGAALRHDQTGDVFSRSRHDRAHAGHGRRDVPGQSRAAHRQLRQARQRRESAARTKQRARLRAHGLRAGQPHRHGRPREGRTLFENVWRAPVPKAKGLDLMQMMDAATTGAQGALGHRLRCGADQSQRQRHRAVIEIARVRHRPGHVPQRTRARVRLRLLSGRFVVRAGRHVHEFGAAHPARAQSHRSARGGESRIGKSSANSPARWAKASSLISIRRRKSGKKSAPCGRPVTASPTRGSKHGGLQWPCPTEDHPGTTVLHAKSFPSGPRAPLQRIEFTASKETTSPEFPFLLITGRTLYQFNAGTMTMRTRERRPASHRHCSTSPPKTRRDSDCATASGCECEAITAMRLCQFESIRR